MHFCAIINPSSRAFSIKLHTRKRVQRKDWKRKTLKMQPWRTSTSGAHRKDYLAHFYLPQHAKLESVRVKLNAKTPLLLAESFCILVTLYHQRHMFPFLERLLTLAQVKDISNFVKRKTDSTLARLIVPVIYWVFIWSDNQCTYWGIEVWK